MCCGHAAARIKSQGTTALSLSLSPPLFSTPPINPLDIPYSRFSFFSPCNSPPTMAQVSSRKEKERERAPGNHHSRKENNTRDARATVGPLPPLPLPSLANRDSNSSFRDARDFLYAPATFSNWNLPQRGWIVHGQDYRGLSIVEREICIRGARIVSSGWREMEEWNFVFSAIFKFQ